ncbi:MAG TPA: ABC transporter permease [Terriglobia bacterium]|nr:ABC transporter permease [Terriglobia bacterium]
MATFLHDLRYALRTFARNPGVSFVMILTLGLAIGANTAIFSAVYGVLLRPLPYPKPDQIVSVSEVAADGHLMSFAGPNFHDLRVANHTFAGMAECNGGNVITVSSGSGPARVDVTVVSRDFFKVMGVAPFVGREFSADETREGGTPAAIASYGYWRRHLGGATDLAPLKLKTELWGGDQVFSVVGVMPPGFSFPADSDLWVPAEFFGDGPSRTAHNWRAPVGRLREGVTLEQARQDLSTIAHHLSQQYKPDIDMTDASVVPLRDSLTGNVRQTLLILLGAVGFLLLVGCANVANLLLARAAARERELAVRVALGAGRGRLVRQFLAESLLLALAGGTLGVLAAQWGVSVLVALAPPHLPRVGEVSINVPVLLFALSVSILVAMGLGVLTALRATAHDPQGALVEGSRGQAGSVRSQRVGRFLVAGQLAITLVLLAGAGLLGRSLLRVLSLDPGFRTENIVTMEFELPTPANKMDDARPARVVNNVFERLRGVPGIEEVGGATRLPLASGFDPDGAFLILNRQSDFTKPEDWERLVHTVPTGYADYVAASEDYFKALGIPLLHGRLFSDRDTADAPHVAVISQSLAQETWPNQDPIGKTIEFGNMDGDMRLLAIVGIVGDIRALSLEKAAKPTVYVNYRQRPIGGRDFTVVMRAAIPPATVLAATRNVMHEVDPDVAPQFRTFQDVFSASLATRRFNLVLVGVFAGAALLLASVGIYGVMAYWVERRTREIGLRMALGAVPGDVLRLVLGHGSWTIAAGVVVGLAGAFALTRTMESLLFGVSAADPVTFAGVGLLLAGVALLASYIPARRATKVDPMVALRYE